MTAYSRHPKEQQLLQLSAEVTRIAGTLAQLSTHPIEKPRPEPGKTGAPALSAQTVCRVIKSRRQRSRYFSEDLFADPAWDILLDLLYSELMQTRVSVSSLCLAAAVPATTALRWINSMVQQGLITRHEDPRDRRRVFVELAPDVSLALHHYFADIEDPLTI